ncbi:MAG TPA: hypothetical protein VMZ49_12465 [Patescibacteria group bacterium]|nr:hypothetical protein [Patescibacteria group bacterium]
MKKKSNENIFSGRLTLEPLSRGKENEGNKKVLKNRVGTKSPLILTQGKLSDAFAWVGLYQSFEKAGFEIVDRTSKNRPMVRYYTYKMK